MKILLVYELIPEDTKLYVFDNVNPEGELFKHLVGANGHYVNYDGSNGDNSSTEFLTEYLTDREELKIEDLPQAGPFNVVVHSGFGL